MSSKYNVEYLRKNKFSLVLSGGSAYGFAHIGVIKFLEENNLKPDEIIGTSIGAIFGAIFAIGYGIGDEEELLSKISWLKLFSLQFGKAGLKSRKIYDFLQVIFGDRKMSDVVVDLKIIAANMYTGEVRVFTKDDDLLVVDCVIASMSIPGIFSPHQIGDDYFIDGFVVSNLGVEFVKRSNICFAVNVENSRNLPVIDMKKKYFSNLKNLFSMFKKTYGIMLINQTKAKLERMSGLVLIEPCLKGFYRSDFSKWKDIVDVGYEEVKSYFK